MRNNLQLCGEPNLVFNDYKKTGLYIPIYGCTMKCVKEARKRGDMKTICQNSELLEHGSISYPFEKILDRITSDPFIECIIFSGMEPMDSFDDIYSFIKQFRKLSDLEIVIFTGYDYLEIIDKIIKLQRFPDITMKFGRYKADFPVLPKYDEVGKVTLASGNQYFRKIS
jgi:hypothetical protein